MDSDYEVKSFDSIYRAHKTNNDNALRGEKSPSVGVWILLVEALVYALNNIANAIRGRT